MTQKKPVLDTKRLADTLVGGAKKYIDDKLLDFEKRLVALEARENNLKYFGVWQKAIEYKKNNLITANGSLWIALKDNPEGRPATSEDWQLVAKGAI